MWIWLAIASAVFAGLTAILAKAGIRKADSNVVTALRTCVVFVFAWIMAWISGGIRGITDISSRSLLFLCLSGLATGASWLCYFKALQLGDVSKVTPVDKSSTILTILLAMILFHETEKLALRLIATVLMAVGTMLMIGKQAKSSSKSKRGWLMYALLSAVFASLTSILAKVGIDGVESNLGTAIRTSVVLVMAWIMVFVTGKGKAVSKVSGREGVFIVLSGFATGASWLCYYRAIQIGNVGAVAAIDKMSLLVTVSLSALIFREKVRAKAWLGLLFMLGSTIMLSIL